MTDVSGGRITIFRVILMKSLPLMRPKLGTEL